MVYCTHSGNKCWLLIQAGWQFSWPLCTTHAQAQLVYSTWYIKQFCAQYKYRGLMMSADTIRCTWQNSVVYWTCTVFVLPLVSTNGHGVYSVCTSFLLCTTVCTVHVGMCIWYCLCTVNTVHVQNKYTLCTVHICIKDSWWEGLHIPLVHAIFSKPPMVWCDGRDGWR